MLKVTTLKRRCKSWVRLNKQTLRKIVQKMKWINVSRFYDPWMVVASCRILDLRGWCRVSRRRSGGEGRAASSYGGSGNISTVRGCVVGVIEGYLKLWSADNKMWGVRSKGLHEFYWFTSGFWFGLSILFYWVALSSILSMSW